MAVVLSTLPIILFALLFLGLAAWALWQINVAKLDNFAYPLRSTALFVGFQLFIVPLAMLLSILSLQVLEKVVYPFIFYQSIVMTTLFNYLVEGQAMPAPIDMWLLLGVPLHAAAGFLLGRLLEDRLQIVGQNARLLGALALFEVALTMALIAFARSPLWVEVWRMPERF